MKKYLLLIAVLFLTTYAHGIKQKILENYNKAFAELDKRRNQIKVDSWKETTYVYVNGHVYPQTVTHFKYSGPDDALKAKDAYVKAKDGLNGSLLSESLGDGFAIGIGVACFDKLLRCMLRQEQPNVAANILSSYNLRNGILLFLSSLGMRYYKSASYKKLPSFSNGSLEKNESLYNNFDLSVETLLSFGASSFSFLGTHYLVAKVCNLFTSFKKKAVMQNADTLCPICLDTKGFLSTVRPCGHAFHRDCITRWMRSNPTCPSCRGGIGSIV